METVDLLVDAFGRIREVVHHVVEDLSPEQLVFRADPDANSIAWLVWHLTRIMDDHVSDAAGVEQVWSSQGWIERLALPFDAVATGYAQTADDVAAVRVGAPDLIAYHDAVQTHTLGYVGGIDSSELDRIVDESWDPPVSVGVRLVSVIGDALQHAGQAAYVRGLVERRR